MKNRHANSALRDQGMFRSIAAIALCIGLMLLSLPSQLYADGGIVRVREEKAPYIVTIFSPAEVAARAPTDISVLVQDSRTGEVITDATVDIILTAPGGVSVPSGDPFCTAPMNVQTIGGISAGSSVTFRATREHSANKLLYGLPVMLNASGAWTLRASVWRAGPPVIVSCQVPVGEGSGQLSDLWYVLAIPPIAICLFVLNQRLRHRADGVALQTATQS